MNNRQRNILKQAAANNIAVVSYNDAAGTKDADGLARSGYVKFIGSGQYQITDAGRGALEAKKAKKVKSSSGMLFGMPRRS